MKLVILDRDGVINKESAAFVKSPEEWLPLPGSLDAVATLTKQGFTTAVLTNQSGIGRGYFDYHDLAGIHEKMLREVATRGGRISAIFFCPHAPDVGCACRKPGTGLYAELKRYFGVALDGVPSIGDSMRDLDAARSAGARPVLVRTGNGRRTEAALPDDAGIPVYDDLAAAVAALVAR